MRRPRPTDPLASALLDLPHLHERLDAGADVLVLGVEPPNVARHYPACRFRWADAQALDGLQPQVDLVAASGPLAAPDDVPRILRLVHLCLHPGGTFVWADEARRATALGEAGFADVRRTPDRRSWLGKKSVR